MSSETSTVKRNNYWTDSKTRQLIAARLSDEWSTVFELYKNNPRKIKATWMQFCEDEGFDIGYIKVKSKYNDLLSSYRTFKIENERSGAEPVKWKYFSLFNGLMEKDVLTEPELSVEIGDKEITVRNNSSKDDSQTSRKSKPPQTNEEDLLRVQALKGFINMTENHQKFSNFKEETNEKFDNVNEKLDWLIKLISESKKEK